MKIDINTDCGESFGNWEIGDDDLLLQKVTTANLACGFHAGDPATMVASVERAKRYGVAVGAHPGLPDLVGFGRRRLLLSAEDLYADLLYQVGALKTVLETRGMELHHVKVHGALAFMVRESREYADAFLEVVKAVMPKPLVYSPNWPNDVMHVAAAEQGIPVVVEYYPDLRYTAEGDFSLARKREPVPEQEVVEQVTSLLTNKVIKSVDGTDVPMHVGSISFHGDAPNAPRVAAAIEQALRDVGAEKEAVAR